MLYCKRIILHCLLWTAVRAYDFSEWLAYVNYNPDSPPPEQQHQQAASSAVTDKEGVTYKPGNLTHIMGDLILSEGLTARVVAEKRSKVTYRNGAESDVTFHPRPDGAATFVDERAENKGGWIYVSNSEVKKPEGGGGVGAVTFDADGNVIHYEMLLTGTTWNCAGGRTPWDTWISCEESDNGTIWEVDPYGNRDPVEITLGKDRDGKFESFAYDLLDRNEPHFYVTRDTGLGALRRFTPDDVDWTNPRSMLQGSGKIEYLVLEPANQTKPNILPNGTFGGGPNNNALAGGGTYRWVSDKNVANQNAEILYPNSEGIDVDGTTLYFVSKTLSQIYELDLADGRTYKSISTVNGLFDGQPDQLQRILGHGNSGSTSTTATLDNTGESSSGTTQNDQNTVARSDIREGLLYFTEEGGVDAGVHARDAEGNYYTILESPFLAEETTGLAFSPDGRHLYVCYQKSGKLFDVTRTDGYPFNYKTLDVKYFEPVEGEDG